MIQGERENLLGGDGSVHQMNDDAGFLPTGLFE
jgi:hypothetical protein